MIWLTAIAIGVPVGLIMGLTGAGGGMLALSALVLLLDWNMQIATPVALTAVTAGALIGGIDGLRKQQVRFRAAFLMAATGAPMATAGVYAARMVSEKWLMACFAGVLAWVAMRLIAQNKQHGNARQADADRQVIARLNPVTGRFDWNTNTATVIASIGGIAGFMTGLLGVGGGFVIVPLLRHYSNVSMHAAVATSLLVIALVGTVGVSTAILHGVNLPVEFTAAFIASTVVGMLIGRRLVAHLSSRTVQGLFAMLLLLVALGMVIKVKTL